MLPTSGTARFASGLSANDFLRANSILHFGREGMMRLAPDVRVLATKEGLTAHRASVEVRMKGRSPIINVWQRSRETQMCRGLQ